MTVAYMRHSGRLGLPGVLILGHQGQVRYATLRPFNRPLATLAMIFSLGDSFLALVVRMCSFVRVHFYISSASNGGNAVAQGLSDLMRSIADVTENLGGISYGIGLLLVFYLFFKSRSIPRALSALGLLASVIWVTLYFANLVFTEQHSLFLKLCFPPMALADVLTGFYLLLFAVNAGIRGSDHARQVHVPG